jgi:multimeric flavodoxin WrbA
MKKVTAFIGTESKKATYKAVQEFEKNLKQYGDIDFEYVFLSDYHLEFCHGCKLCLIKGEEFCPSKDDRDILLEKMEHSDGIILATPTYAFQVSARMKNFLDRISFIYHRPRFFNKICTAVVTQGIYGGGNVLKYLNFAGEGLGFRVSKGCYFTTLDPITKPQEKKLIEEIKKASLRYYEELKRPISPPSFFRLMAFRIGRTSIKFEDQSFRDYHYYKEKGWLESDYYYPTSLGLIKKFAGKLSDLIGQHLYKPQ